MVMQSVSNYCFVCRQIVPNDQAHYDGRFNLAFCDTHKNVPPAYKDRAIAQFKATGKTQWDVANGFS